MDESLATQQQYYDEYWSRHDDRLNPHEILRLAEIFKCLARVVDLKRERRLRICDLGCGRGWLSYELSKFGAVTGVDLSTVGVAKAASQWPHITFRVADIAQWRPPETFDLVVSSEVLEHVPDQKAVSMTIGHLLREGGYLILTTPNGKVKRHWDRDNAGSQLVEEWLSPGNLRRLFSQGKVVHHGTFLYDFSYAGMFRLLSAPKVLSLIDACRLTPLYDALRNMCSLGLYQVMLLSYEPPAA